MEDLMTKFVWLRQRTIDDATRLELGNRVVDEIVKNINPAHEFSSGLGLLHSDNIPEDPNWPSTPDHFEET